MYVRACVSRSIHRRKYKDCDSPIRINGRPGVKYRGPVRDKISPEVGGGWGVGGAVMGGGGGGVRAHK